MSNKQQAAGSTSLLLEETTTAQSPRFRMQPALRAIGIMSMALLLGTGIPALLAYHEHVFFQDDVRSRLPPEASKRMFEFESEKRKMKDDLDRIDRELSSVALGSQAHQVLLEAKRVTNANRASLNQPIQYFSFMRTPASHFYFPLFFLALGVLAFLAHPPIAVFNHKAPIWRTIALAIGIYVVWQWFHWVRNFVTGEEARFVYACIQTGT